jgi:glycosyltransferase involved in cell wall biosynthesis
VPLPERLRVLQATPGYAPAYGLGGPTQSLEGLAKHLARLGVDVRVLTTDCAGKTERLQVGRGWQTWEGIPVRYVRRWLPPDVSPTYFPLAVIEARRADVVHVTGIFSVPSMQAMVAAIATKRPVVLSARGVLEEHALDYGPVRRKQSWLAACKPLLRRVTTFHATSNKEADSIRKALGSAVHVQVIPNGVDLPPSGRRVEREAGDPIIGFLGRIHRVKALGQLIEAAAILRDRAPRFALQLAGPTPDRRYREELQAQVQRLGLQGMVVLPGELLGEAKRAFYERCRVVVLPSTTENFGNIVPEALSHGVPVVASRFTPWAELEEAGCGRWVENSPTELANAIEPYLRSADLSRSEGERGLALVKRRYTWEAVARSMIDVYREARDRHRRS